MKTTDFEKKLQKELDPDITIRVNPNHSDIVGVYWKEHYLSVSVPPEEIKEEVDKGYTDKIGYPYKSRPMAEELVIGKLAKFKKAVEEEPELFNQD